MDVASTRRETHRRSRDATLDSLSSVYYLRTLKLDGRNRSRSRSFPVEPRVLQVEIQGARNDRRPGRDVSRRSASSPRAAGSGLVGKNLVLWLTDDARKIPVQIRSKLKVAARSSES